MIGTVKKWISEKGFGFIVPAGAVEGEGDIFVHVTGLLDGRKGLNAGEQVSYDERPGDRGRGPKAVNVRVVT